MNLQEAIDAPAWHIEHFPLSFWPRTARPGVLVVEGRLPKATIKELQRRGHKVEVGPDWSEGRLSAASQDGVAPQGRRQRRAACRGTRRGGEGRRQAREQTCNSCYSDCIVAPATSRPDDDHAFSPPQDPGADDRRRVPRLAGRRERPQVPARRRRAAGNVAWQRTHGTIQIDLGTR